MKKFLAEFRRIENLLRTDLEFRSFHEGRSSTLPGYYRWVYERKLGGYASLLSAAERTPELGQARPTRVVQPIADGRNPALPPEAGLAAGLDQAAGAAGPL